MLLAIDTSNDYAGIALRDERGLRAEATWASGRQHTEQLLPQIDLLMRHVGVQRDKLAAVAVATGPGSWSGLRAGLGLAKALAIAGGLPVLGVPTLDALAYGQRRYGLPVLAVVRLGRDRYGIAGYGESRGAWVRAEEFRVATAQDIAALAQGVLVVGDISSVEVATGEDIAPGVSAVEHQRRAAYVAELGWDRHTRASYDDLVALEPIYLGGPVR